MTRKAIPEETQTSILLKSRRRCCLCFWLKGEDEVKKGQLAHLDGDHENCAEDNLAFMCFEHHDEYDSRTRISKGLREREVKRWRDELYREMEYRFRTINDAPARLGSAVRKLLKFPDAIPDDSRPPTTLETLFVNKLPCRIFDLLMEYQEKDVLQVPGIGGVLHKHLTTYYRFRQEALRVEADLMSRIAAIVGDCFNSHEVWRMYFRYALPRFCGKTKEDVIAWGNYLNYGVTWDGAERVFATLAQQEAASSEVSQLLDMFEDLSKSLKGIDDVRE